MEKKFDARKFIGKTRRELLQEHNTKHEGSYHQLLFILLLCLEKLAYLKKKKKKGAWKKQKPMGTPFDVHRILQGLSQCFTEIVEDVQSI